MIICHILNYSTTFSCLATRFISIHSLDNAVIEMTSLSLRCQQFPQLSKFLEVLHDINSCLPEHFHQNAVVSLIQPNIRRHRRAEAIVGNVKHLAPGPRTFNNRAVSSGSLETVRIQVLASSTLTAMRLNYERESAPTAPPSQSQSSLLSALKNRKVADQHVKLSLPTT